MQAAVPLIPWLLLLASCSSPPKPPTVDESQKRPVNSQMAIELQVCRNDLQNTRLLAAESGRLAESTTATLGKTAGKDADRNKPTYVTTLGVTRSRAFATELRQQALDALDPFADRARRLRELADFIVLRKF